MADFRFRLATLLQLREAARDQRRVALAETCRADEELAGQLTAVGLECRQLQVERRQAAAPGEVNIDQLVDAHRYVLSLRSQKNELIEQRNALAEEMERRRTALIEADRNVQVLEKLRERRFDRYRLEEERRAAKQLDEIALQAAAS
jgi:flagellar protein FliJ